MPDDLSSAFWCDLRSFPFRLEGKSSFSKSLVGFTPTWPRCEPGFPACRLKPIQADLQTKAVLSGLSGILSFYGAGLLLCDAMAAFAEEGRAEECPLCPASVATGQVSLHELDLSLDEACELCTSD